MFSILEVETLNFLKSKLLALFSSNLVIAVKLQDGIDGALAEQTKALVLHGFPTTHTLTVFFAN